jgi:uncharacterized protein YegL
MYILYIVDESGSMNGAPTKQCQYSLHRFLDLSYKHKHLVSSIIAYDDTARVTHINTNNPRSQYETVINAIGRGGGTRFSSAFEKIIQVLEVNKANQDISSAVICFMSDGQDSCNDRKKLTNDFKVNIEKIWKRNYTVHTIGFGNGHDYAFLDGLKKIGTTEGAYRFADPTENPDMLSGKINSVLDVIAQSCIIPIEVESCNIKILGGENSKYWCRPTTELLAKPCNITITVNGEKFTLPIEIDVVASATGKLHSVEEILKVTQNDITMVNQANKNGNTALDLAILFGYNDTTKTLLDVGGIINSDPKILFLTCKHRKTFGR